MSLLDDVKATDEEDFVEGNFSAGVFVQPAALPEILIR